MTLYRCDGIRRRFGGLFWIFLKDLEVPEKCMFYCVCALSLWQKYSEILGYDLRICLFVLHVVYGRQDGGAASFET